MSAVGDARIKVPDHIAKGDAIIVNSIISHPMDTGFFRTADGQPIPAWFIKDVVVTYGGPGDRALRVDLGDQPGSGGELHAQGRQGRPAHDGLDGQQGVGVHQDAWTSRSRPPDQGLAFSSRPSPSSRLLRRAAEATENNMFVVFLRALRAFVVNGRMAPARVERSLTQERSLAFHHEGTKSTKNSETIVSFSSVFLCVLCASVVNTPFPVRELAPGVYAVVGDTGRGSEGRPNAGFIVTSEGVVVIDALASPRDGARLLETIRRTTKQPVKWLVLTHHHPDHHFGAIVFKRAGAKVIAHPDRRTLALDGGEDALIADWVRVVGLDAMRGFEFADTPDRPVTGSDTLRMGGTTIVITHPGAGHTAGDLMIWLPKARVLFAGDLLVEDGVTMMVDGSSKELLKALDAIDRLDPRVVVPGHGAIPRAPA